MKSAVFYGRVSDRKQADKQAEDEVQLPAQIEAAKRTAAGLDANIVREFVDDGRSGFKENNRPAFESAIEYAVTHSVDFFITWSTSRFARNKFESCFYKRDLDRAGVKLIYVSMHIDRATDEGWLVESMMEIFDELRSRDTAKDTKRSLIRNAQAGYFCGGVAPFGFVAITAPDNPKRRKLVPLPEEAARLREIFDLRLAGFGGKAIAQRYNALGIRYRTLGSWKKDTVLHMLRNEAAIGQTIFNRLDRKTGRIRARDEWVIVQSHDAAIDLDLWNEVQAIMSDVSTTPEGRGTSLSSHVFSGLLHCEACAGALTIETGKGNGGTYSYYSCRRGKRNGSCSTKRWPAAPLEEFLSSVIFDRILDRESLTEMAEQLVDSCGEWQRQQQARRQALVHQIGAVQTRNSRLYGVLELEGRDAPNLGDLTERLRANKAEIKGLEAELFALDAEPAPAVGVESIDLNELAGELRSLFTESASVARLRAFYKSFIRSVTLRGDAAEIDYEPARLIATAGPVVHRLEDWRPKLDSNQRPPD